MFQRADIARPSKKKWQWCSPRNSLVLCTTSKRWNWPTFTSSVVFSQLATPAWKWNGSSMEDQWRLATDSDHLTNSITSPLISWAFIPKIQACTPAKLEINWEKPSLPVQWEYTLRKIYSWSLNILKVWKEYNTWKMLPDTRDRNWLTKWWMLNRDSSQLRKIKKIFAKDNTLISSANWNL